MDLEGEGEEKSVPNVPCGVESRMCFIWLTRWKMFLMHRVELKDGIAYAFKDREEVVPNAPCGVESRECGRNLYHSEGVPNAPCGVERGSIVVGSFIRPCS